MLKDESSSSEESSSVSSSVFESFPSSEEKSDDLSERSTPKMNEMGSLLSHFSNLEKVANFEV